MKKPTAISINDLRPQLTACVAKSLHKKETFIITKNGKPQAKLCPLSQQELLEFMRDEYMDS